MPEMPHPSLIPDPTASQDFLRLQEVFFNTPSQQRFYCPSRVHWGSGAFDLALPVFSGRRALLCYDTAFVSSRFLLELRQRLDPASTYFEIARPPSPENIDKMFTMAGELPLLVIAIGGGSTLDAAKCITARYLFGSIDGIGMGSRRGEAPSPLRKPLLVAFPSTAGTGADTSRYYVTYREEDSAKVHGKSWQLIFDWVFLDPEIAVSAPMRLRIESALDAFIHLTESFLCRQEESWPNSALCLAGLDQLRQGLDIIQADAGSLPGMTKLQSASTMAGVAISNVRTGHIHEMAGALLSKTGLTHPETLAVFFADGLAELEASTEGRTKLTRIANNFGCKDWSEVADWWHTLLSVHGVRTLITSKLKSLGEERIAHIRHAVIEHTAQDFVWNEKESPLRITREVLARIFDAAMMRFCR